MKRPTFLTVWLTLIVLLNIIYLLRLLWIFSNESFGLPSWFLPFAIIVSLAEMAGAYFLWKWMKIGFYIYTSAAVLNMLINVFLLGTGGIGVILFGCIGIGILYWAMQPVWGKFK